MDSNTTALIEFIKFFSSFLNPKTGKQFFEMTFSGPMPRDLRIANELILTPDDYEFYIEKLQFCYELSMDFKIGETTLAQLKNFSGLKFLLKTNSQGSVIFNKSFEYNPDGTNRRCYIFFSEFYNNLKNDIQTKIENTYGKKEYFENNNSQAMYPYSLIIIIKDNTGNGEYFTAFEKFLLMTLEQWNVKFHSAVSIALSNDGNYDIIQKYHPEIFVHALSYENRIALIKKIAKQEHWGIMDLDGVNEQDFILKLIENISDDDGSSLYNDVFGNNAALFRKLDEKFDNQGNLRFVIILMRIRYNYVLLTEGQTGLENYITVIPAHYTIPVRKIKKDGIYQYGPQPIVELLNDHIHITTIDYWAGLYIIQGESPFSYLYKDFPYEEMINVFVVNEHKDFGLADGRIIPIPAFALKGFSEGISEDVTITDVIKKFTETMGIILPFLKLTYLLSEGVYLVGEVAGTSISLGNAFTGQYISSFLDEKLKATPTGAIFLQAYNYISFMYSNKDIINKGIPELISNIKNGNKLALSDGENLMTLWDDYYEVNKAIYDAINSTESEIILKRMQKLQQEINRVK